MGRLVLVVLICGCSYASPADPTNTPPIDTPNEPDPDGSTTLPPDSGVPEDAPPPVPQTTDHVSAADTWLESDQPTLNHATQAFVITDGDILATSLLRFDLSAIGVAQVLAAELHIFTDFDPGAQVQVFRVLEPWTEAGATWNQRVSGTNWTATGAGPPSSGMTAIGTFTPGTANTEFTVAIDPVTVAAWLADPASNFGIAIRSVNADGPRFRSREAATGKPVLRVTHVP